MPRKPWKLATLIATLRETSAQKATGWPCESWIVRDDCNVPFCNVTLYRHGGRWHAWNADTISATTRATREHVADLRNAHANGPTTIAL
jgi:hypothetical protein